MILSIVEQALIALPLIIGAYLTISLLKLPDFSIESAYLFGAVFAFLARELPLSAVIFGAILGGMLVGFLVCLINQILHIPFLLAAIVTNGLVHGLTQYLLVTASTSFAISLPTSEIVLLSCTGLLIIIPIGFCLRSELGYCFAIFGNNPHFFQHHPVSGRYVVFAGVMLGHGCAGVSGFLFAQSNGFVDLTMNVGVILLCLTAIMMGKIFFSGRRPTIIIPIIGAGLYFLTQQSLLRLGLDLKYFNAFQALCILMLLYVRHRRQSMTLDHLGV